MVKNREKAIKKVEFQKNSKKLLTNSENGGIITHVAKC